MENDKIGVLTACVRKGLIDALVGGQKTPDKRSVTL